MKQESLVHSRKFRWLIMAVAYTILLAVSMWLAYQLRFDFFVKNDPLELAYLERLPVVLSWILPFKLIVLVIFRQYSGLLSYFGTPDVMRLGRAVCCWAAILGLIRLQIPDTLVPSRGIILMDTILSFSLLVGFRVACRSIREALTISSASRSLDERSRIVILGAGDVGADLAKDLLNKRGLGRIPVAFLDDNPAKHGTRIHDIPVAGFPADLPAIKDRFKVDEVVIAMPSAPVKRIAEIVNELRRLHLNFVTVPSLDQMATGQVKVSQLRSVEIQDLLGRDPVVIERETIGKVLTGKVVLVTGAGGSIGSELCRQIATFNPKRILLFEHCEFLLFQIEQELLEKGYGSIVQVIMGELLDESRTVWTFERYQPEIVFHAAALKHVPMMENQPREAFKVNSLGTMKLAKLAAKYRVDRFVLVSTDKAINPTSAMGATKRLAEMSLQAIDSDGGVSTRFMAVRFGNVLGSSGSVIPTFRKQIAAGGPLKVTHPDVTRYFMTIPEAVGLVLQCGTRAEGGEIFVLDMGEPIKIVDLANQMIELSGFRPQSDIEIEFVGLRPGEKLFEELQHTGENLLETDHPKIFRMVREDISNNDTEARVLAIAKICDELEPSQLKQRIQEIVPEYSPYL